MDGAGVRKVAVRTPNGSEITLETEDAAASDVVKDGKIGWTYRVAYDALPDRAYETAMAQMGLQRAPALASIGDLRGSSSGTSRSAARPSASPARSRASTSSSS